VVELASTVQGVLFPPDGKDRIASEDSNLFAMVMAEFNTFEIEVCHIGCALNRQVATYFLIKFCLGWRPG